MTRQEAIAELAEEKRELLAVSDLVWIWTHDAWGNKDRRAIFAQEWLTRSSLDDIKRALAERAAPDEWKQFFTRLPSPAVLARIIHELG